MSEVNPSDYLASSLVNPDPETERGVQAFIDARAEGGNPMSYEEERKYREEMLRASGFDKRRMEEQMKDPYTHFSGGEGGPVIDPPVVAGLQMGARAAGIDLGGPDRYGPPPTSSAEMADAPTSVPAPEIQEEVTVVPPQAPSSGGGRIGARIGPDGKVIFTNIGVDDSPASDAAYRKGVSSFREDMRAHQAGLGPPPEDTVNVMGHVTPGGHMLGDPDAPIPGDPDYVEGGFVSSMGTVAPTDRALEEGEWEDMTPGAQRAYAQQVAGRSQTEQARAGGQLAEHEARLATDPEYRAQHRTALVDRYTREALADEGVQAGLQQTIAAFKAANPQITEDSPEYLRMISEAQRRFVEDYLQRKYQSVAPWDDVLSRNIGLTIG